MHKIQITAYIKKGIYSTNLLKECNDTHRGHFLVVWALFVLIYLCKWYVTCREENLPHPDCWWLISLGKWFPVYSVSPLSVLYDVWPRGFIKFPTKPLTERLYKTDWTIQSLWLLVLTYYWLTTKVGYLKFLTSYLESLLCLIGHPIR